jgi:sterol desaturase/sphingolipid hydroxylase (fatty acid hydroxylase superfamily)
MDWMAAIGDDSLRTLAWLAGLAAAFALLVRLMPCNRGMYWWKDPRAAGTDVLYWLVLPLCGRVGRTLLLAAAMALPFVAAPGLSAIRRLPLWRQCLAVLLIQDALLYWIHRGFHTRLGWKFHSIHHSSAVLDWLSASRFHLVNNLLAFTMADVAVLLMGFAPAALLALAPFNVVYSAMVHANLNWTFGPLRYLFASPVFHRWHHTADGAGLDRNYAPTLPLLDVIFGTFHMPPGVLPERFGNGDHDFPEDFWGQFIYPFTTGKFRGADATPLAALMGGSAHVAADRFAAGCAKGDRGSESLCDGKLG